MTAPFGQVPFDPASFESVHHGRAFEDFEVGQEFVHHWGRTLTAADNALFSTSMCCWLPMYLNVPYSKAHGHRDVVVHPMLVLCTVVGMSVEDLSEYGGAFLGLEDCTFHRPLYPGDTLTARSTVTATRPSNSRPGGIVTWHTEGYDQAGEVVVDFVRTNLVRGAEATLSTSPSDSSTLVGRDGFFEDFTVGQRLRHSRGATISDVENNMITKLVMNTAEGHWNEFAMRSSVLGEGRVVFGLVTASIVFGLASQDTAEQALAELGCGGLRFSSPVHVGDTLYAYTEVLECRPSDVRDDAGIARFHHWGLLDDDRVVFEGERTVLLKRRSHWVTSS